jgi:hypothetical protein
MDELLMGLLSPEQQIAAQQQAQQAGLLNLGFGLLQASQGQRGQPRPGFGQIVGQAGPQALQAYQGSFDQTLKNLVLGQQLQEAQAKRSRETAVQGAISKLSESPEFANNPTMQAFLMANPEKALEFAAKPPETSSTFRDYQQAVQQGFQGSFLDYQTALKEAGRSQQIVKVGGGKVGNIPPGYELREDPKTGALSMAPIPGGPIEKQEMEEASKAKGRKEQQARAGGTVVQDLQRALNIVQVNPAATGRTAAATALLPGVARAETDYQAAEAFVQSALSNVGLDTLQQMRENSPTGGALGQVPIQQQTRLEQVLGSLDLTQRKEVVEDNLKRVINIYMDIIHGSKEQVEDAYNRGEISNEERKIFGFRHNLSFDESGRPVSKGKTRSLRDIFGGQQ